MKGVIPICLMEMIMVKFGENKLNYVLKAAKIYDRNYLHFLPTEDVPDADVLNVISASCSTLNFSLEQLANEFGEYWCVTYAPKIYAPYFNNVTCAKDFLMKMQKIHERVTRTIPNASPPSFEYISNAPSHLIMKYSSNRNLQPLWIGLIKGVGIAFNEKLDIKLLDANTVEIIFGAADG